MGVSAVGVSAVGVSAVGVSALGVELAGRVVLVVRLTSAAVSRVAPWAPYYDMDGASMLLPRH